KPEQQHRQRFGPQVVGDPVLVRTHASIVYWSLTKHNQNQMHSRQRTQRTRRRSARLRSNRDRTGLLFSRLTALVRMPVTNICGFGALSRVDTRKNTTQESKTSASFWEAEVSSRMPAERRP